MLNVRLESKITIQHTYKTTRNKNTKGSGKRNKIKKYLILFISTFSRIIYKNNPSLTITILFIVALSTFSKLIFSIDERCHNNALLFQKKKKMSRDITICETRYVNTKCSKDTKWKDSYREIENIETCLRCRRVRRLLANENSTNEINAPSPLIVHSAPWMTLFLTTRSPKITVCRKIGVTKGATRVIRSIFGEPERLNPTCRSRKERREGMIIGTE